MAHVTADTESSILSSCTLPMPIACANWASWHPCSRRIRRAPWISRWSRGVAKLARGAGRRPFRIAQGMQADIVVLDRDLEALAPEEIDTARAALSLCGGETTWEA